MRNARDFVDDYRRKGYPDDRIRIIASMRPEPLRTEALAILDAETQSAVAATPAPPVQESAERTVAAATSAEASGAAAATAAARQEPAAGAREPAGSGAAATASDAEARKALRQEAATARSEREKVAGELKKVTADLAHARADLARLLTTNAEVPALRERIEQLQRAVAEKEKLLREKERAIVEKEAALSAERSQREAAVSRAEKLVATVEGQNQRLKELDAFHRQMAGANEELEQLRTNAAQLKEDVEAKCTHIAQLQADLTQTRNDATLLREQIESNGNAIGQLQEKLTSREAELEALRSHFDCEAADLKKRAEQEMWVIRRRLRRVHRMAALGGVVAACLVVVLGFNTLGKSRRISNLRAELDAARAARSMVAVNPDRPAMPGPRPVNVTQPFAPTVVAPQRPVVTSLTLPTVNEPPRDGGTTTGPTGPSTRMTTDPAAVAPASARRAAVNAGSRVVTYTVKKGDTLGAISQRFLNDPTKWRDIAKENSLQGSQIREGMELHITVASSN